MTHVPMADRTACIRSVDRVRRGSARPDAQGVGCARQRSGRASYDCPRNQGTTARGLSLDQRVGLPAPADAGVPGRWLRVTVLPAGWACHPPRRKRRDWGGEPEGGSARFLQDRQPAKPDWTAIRSGLERRPILRMTVRCDAPEVVEPWEEMRRLTGDGGGWTAIFRPKKGKEAQCTESVNVPDVFGRRVMPGAIARRDAP